MLDPAPPSSVCLTDKLTQSPGKARTLIRKEWQLAIWNEVGWRVWLTDHLQIPDLEEEKESGECIISVCLSVVNMCVLI